MQLMSKNVKKRTISAEHKAAISKANKAHWQRRKQLAAEADGKPPAKPSPKKKSVKTFFRSLLGK